MERAGSLELTTPPFKGRVALRGSGVRLELTVEDSDPDSSAPLRDAKKPGCADRAEGGVRPDTRTEGVGVLSRVFAVAFGDDDGSIFLDPVFMRPVMRPSDE